MHTLFFSLLAFSAVAVASATDLPYQDSNFDCFSSSEAQRYLSDFNVDVESFGGLELCDHHKDTKKLLNDLFLVEKAQFDPDISHGFVRGMVPVNNYYGWMKHETRGMERGNDVPFATAYNSMGYFTMQDGWAALSTLGRVGTVIHEARHTAGYPHYRCTSGPYAASNVSGCDTSYAQTGAHGVEMEYYARVVLQAKNLHPVYQSMARLMLLGRSNFVFNQQPLRKREALLALAGDKLLLADGQSTVLRETPAMEAGARLKRTSAGAALVKGEKSVAVDLYQGSALGTSLADDYSYYKLFQTPRPNAPAEVRDTEEVDIGSIRYFAVLGSQGQVSSYDFPSGRWFPGSAAMPEAQAFVTRTPNGQAGLFAVTTNGSILPFDPATRRYGQALPERWTTDTAAYGLLGTQLVKLTSQGAVVDARSGEAVPAFQGQTVTDLVNVPLYDAFAVVP